MTVCGLLSLIGAGGPDTDAGDDEEAVQIEVICYRVHMTNTD